jgi:hypothetical protein
MNYKIKQLKLAMIRLNHDCLNYLLKVGSMKWSWLEMAILIPPQIHWILPSGVCLSKLSRKFLCIVQFSKYCPVTQQVTWNQVSSIIFTNTCSCTNDCIIHTILSVLKVKRYPPRLSRRIIKKNSTPCKAQLNMEHLKVLSTSVFISIIVFVSPCMNIFIS